MALDRLDVPLRLTWDLHDGAGAVPAPAAPAIAAALAEAGIFFVLLERAPLAHPDFPTLLTTLRSGGVSCAAVFGASDREWAQLAAAAQLTHLFVDAGPAVTSGRLAEIENTVIRLRAAGIEPALYFHPRRGELGRVVELCALCRQLGVTRFKLPNTRVDASFTPAERDRLPLPGEFAALRTELGAEAVAVREGLQLEIHDLFLWEIFYPGERESGRAEYGGCQAGNSLGHISWDGTVVPCSSWPLPLGRLPDEPLEAIWSKPALEELRHTIAAEPPGCRACSDYALCLGGCRGLSATLAPDGDGRDLFCAACRHPAQRSD